MKPIDSERVVIASALLLGWAIWTSWRHLILPALVAVCALLLVLAGWRPEPTPVPVVALPEPTPVPVVALLPAQVTDVRHCWTDPVRSPLRSPQLDTLPSQDLSPAVRRQIRASLGRLKSEA